MERALILGLADGARLLQQVRFNVGAGNVARSIEVNTNKFALQKPKKAPKRFIIKYNST